MVSFDLTEEEQAELTRVLRKVIEGDRYPFCAEA